MAQTYEQLDTEGSQDQVLYYHLDGKRVSGELGGDGGGLWNREDHHTPRDGLVVLGGDLDRGH